MGMEQREQSAVDCGSTENLGLIFEGGGGRRAEGEAD
jgi:hypothetical protein